MTIMFGTTNPIPKLNKVAKGTRIAFFGPMCSGKTFCADYLTKHKNFVRLSLADKLKSIAYELYGAQGKDGKVRELYQKLGDALRAFDNDVFTKYTLRRVDHLENSLKEPISVVIDDLRLPREAHLLRANGFQLIKVECSEDVRLERVQRLYPNVPQAARSHETEVSSEKIRPDATIKSEDAAETENALDLLMEKYWETR